MLVAVFASTDLVDFPGPRGLTLLPTLAIKYEWGGAEARLGLSVFTFSRPFQAV